MARLLYAGTPADFAVALGESVPIPAGGGDGRVALLPESAVTFEVYETPGGVAVTDLLDVDLLPITELTSSTSTASLGSIPPFYGPDGWTADLWATSDGTTFFRIAPSTDQVHDRVTALETAVATLEIDDLADVDTTGATTGQVLGRNSGGQWVPTTTGVGTVTSVNGVTPVAGAVTLAPTNLTPPAAAASGLTAVASIVGARLLQTGSGYPARPSAATWVTYIGAATPVTGVQDGDVWLQPVST